MDLVDFFEALQKEKKSKTKYTPIAGDLYMYRSLAEFGGASGLFPKSNIHFKFVPYALFLITFLQMFAPFCLVVSSVLNIEFGSTEGRWFGLEHFTAYEYGSDSVGISHVFQRLLGLFFLILFNLNGIYALARDRNECRQVTQMARFFKEYITQTALGGPRNLALPDDRMRQLRSCGGQYSGLFSSPAADEEAPSPKMANLPQPNLRWLWYGALVNSMCFFQCSCALLFMFILEEGPKDLVLDAFGLTFLYNMDQIAGDFGFLKSKWDPEVMGEIYGKLADRDGDDMLAKSTHKSCSPDDVYQVSIWVMYAMTVLMPFFYIFVEMDNKRPDAEPGIKPMYNPFD